MAQRVTLVAGPVGPWRIERMIAVAGEGLPAAKRLTLIEGALQPPEDAAFVLRGVPSHARYVTREERDRLRPVSQPLGRTLATHGALIPIRKSQAWWDQAQDERRDLMEAQFRHISEGLRYLPAIARQLLHSRDLGEPFDFLTWFDYAPVDEPAFDKLVGFLRASPEWAFVEREVDIRVVRDE